MKVSDYHPIYLKGSHLPADGSPRPATIESVTLETLHPRPTQEIERIILRFADKPHRLIMNDSNARRLYDLFGDDTEKWVGKTINLSRGQWANKLTVIISEYQNGKGK